MKEKINEIQFELDIKPHGLQHYTLELTKCDINTILPQILNELLDLYTLSNMCIRISVRSVKSLESGVILVELMHSIDAQNKSTISTMSKNIQQDIEKHYDIGQKSILGETKNYEEIDYGAENRAKVRHIISIIFTGIAFLFYNLFKIVKLIFKIVIPIILPLLFLPYFILYCIAGFLEFLYSDIELDFTYDDYRNNEYYNRKMSYEEYKKVMSSTLLVYDNFLFLIPFEIFITFIIWLCKSDLSTIKMYLYVIQAISNIFITPINVVDLYLNIDIQVKLFISVLYIIAGNYVNYTIVLNFLKKHKLIK